MACLGEDELSHIFSYLPTKLICKLKTLRKSLLEYTSGTFFSMTHAQHMLQRDDTCIFIQPDIWSMCPNSTEIHPLPGEDPNFGLPKTSMQFLERVRILASNNGLILCRSKNLEGQVELCICNPITQAWLPIATPTTLLENPDANIHVFLKCINRDLDLDDYMLFLIEDPPEWASNYVNIKVYSPMEGVWKAMEKTFFIGGMNMRLDMPIYLHGALHVISDCPSPFARGSPYFWPYIMAYDFKSGESLRIEIPKDARKGCHDFRCDMRIFEWGKENSSDYSMCLVRCIKQVFTIWVLIDYKSSTWRRILKIRVKGMGVKEEDPKIQGFAVINGDCLIFSTENKTYIYDCTQNSWESKELCKHKWVGRVSFIPCITTLRPCGSDASTIPSVSSSTSTSYTSTCLDDTAICDFIED